MASELPVTATVREAWSKEWKSPAWRIQLLISLTLLLIFGFTVRYFFDFIESRPGKQLSDPLLNLLPSIDISWTIFFFQYLTLLTGLVINRNQPRNILLMVQTYLIVTFTRIVTIYLLPLDPPAGYMPLREPFVQLFTDGGRIISKDLFFSGHVTTLMSVLLSVHHRQARNILTLFVVTVSILLLVQHVHYTIDIIAAPPATWLAYRFCKWKFSPALNRGYGQPAPSESSD